MEYIPVYTLDLETRLKVDGVAFEDNSFTKSELENRAFPEFRSRLLDEISYLDDKLKNTNHSLELLMLDRDIEAIMNIINEKENFLSLQYLNNTPFNIDIHKSFVIYDMALRYRYALGLYETDEPFSSYYERKTKEFRGYEMKFHPYYTLPSLIFPYHKHPDDFRGYFVDELIIRAKKLAEKDVRFQDAYQAIYSQLMLIELPTKSEWSVGDSMWRLGYMEQRAIQAEVIMQIKNQLREAILEENEWEIQKYIDSLYIVYHHNLLSSGIDVNFDLLYLPKLNYVDANFIKTGILGAGMQNTANHYSDDVRILGTRGHGIAAEKANDLIDKALFKDAQILGEDNAKDGADRLVNGDYIQTKYCKTGGKSISECFKNGKFRYVRDGQPMQIEVPRDQYETALQSMRDRIIRGDMENLGITDPNDAEKIVKKGHITYKTAQRIAKAGTIEGITYDAAQGIVMGVKIFGISATLSFAQSIWRGEDADDALNNAITDGSSIFGKQIMQQVATKQIGRTAVERSLRPATDYIVKNVLGSKTSAQIVNTFFRTAGQTQIHGAAAMNHLSKLMRGNIVGMTISTVVLSSGSILDVINGKISRSQLFKNISTTGSSVGGAAIGAALGSVIPVGGTFIGGIIGGIVGGKVSKKALDTVIYDDSVHTIEILKDTFMENIEELELDRDELNFIADKIFEPKGLPKQLKNIYAASSSEEYIENWIDPYIHAVLKARPRIGKIDNMVHSQHDLGHTVN
ncbi:Inner membrane protein yeeR [Bacillus freudenreichii]|nr:Inner membrane protein yeeR [Bacillus freudenreichii]